MTPGQPTQGPQKWTVKPLYQSRERKALTGHFSVELPSGQPIATVYDSEERARLIAEAPNMCQLLADAVENLPLDSPTVAGFTDDARALLARLGGTRTP